MKKTRIISISLNESDAAVVRKLINDLERKLGIRMPVTQLTRYAYRELAKQIAK